MELRVASAAAETGIGTDPKEPENEFRPEQEEHAHDDRKRANRCSNSHNLPQSRNIVAADDQTAAGALWGWP